MKVMAAVWCSRVCGGVWFISENTVELKTRAWSCSRRYDVREASRVGCPTRSAKQLVELASLSESGNVSGSRREWNTVKMQ